MAEYKHPHRFEERVFFAPEIGIDNWERYASSPEEVIGLMTYDDFEPLYPLRLLVFRPMPVDPGWADDQAESFLEQWGEEWHREFSCDGENDDGWTPEDIEALKALCRKVAAQSTPFHCEPTGDVLIVEDGDG